MDARAEFGTAEVKVRVRVRVFSLTPLSVEYLHYEDNSYATPALAFVLSVSGHSISAVAPDHITLRGGTALAYA